MKKLLLVSLFTVSIVSILSVAIACKGTAGSGKLITEKRDLSGFTAIKAGGAVDLEVTQADSYWVEILADDNIMSKISTTVENGVLIITTKDEDFNFFKNSTVRVTVSLPKITALELHGASHGFIKNVKGDKLNLEVSGASWLTVNGKTAELNSEISGASKLDAKSLIADNANVECTGASKAFVFANTTLKIEAGGASKVRYSGNAKVTEETSGASSIAQD